MLFYLDSCCLQWFFLHGKTHYVDVVIDLLIFPLLFYYKIVFLVPNSWCWGADRCHNVWPELWHLGVQSCIEFAGARHNPLEKPQILTEIPALQKLPFICQQSG